MSSGKLLLCLAATPLVTPSSVWWCRRRCASWTFPLPRPPRMCTHTHMRPPRLRLLRRRRLVTGRWVLCAQRRYSCAAPRVCFCQQHAACSMQVPRHSRNGVQPCHLTRPVTACTRPAGGGQSAVSAPCSWWGHGRRLQGHARQCCRPHSARSGKICSPQGGGWRGAGRASPRCGESGAERRERSCRVEVGWIGHGGRTT